MKHKVIIFLLLGSLFCQNSYSYGLRTTFGKVILENIPMGRVYSMRQDAKFPLVIRNDSDQQSNLKLQVLVPKPNEVQEGYEAIPDKSWISLEKDAMAIEPQGEGETDVVIHIPDNEKYQGRKFHVFIWSYTTDGSLGIGLKSKLLFSVERISSKLRF